jgi:hypothetical protein
MLTAVRSQGGNLAEYSLVGEPTGAEHGAAAILAAARPPQDATVLTLL